MPILDFQGMVVGMGLFDRWCSLESGSDRLAYLTQCYGSLM
jgi:hypothetical protein